MPVIGRTFAAATAAFASVALVVACSSSDPAPTLKVGNKSNVNPAADTVKTATGLPCPVSEILSQSCQTCHAASPTAGASTPLVTWADLQVDYGGKKLYEHVKERIHAETGRMPPASRLTTEQIRTLDEWVGSGAPQAADTCDLGQGPPPAMRPLACPAPGRLSTLKAAKPYTWTDDTKTDQYMCYGVDEVVTSKRHIIGLGPTIENLNIVHHVLLCQADEAMSNEAQPCDGTPASWKLVAGWAPGGGNMDLPPAAGFPQEGTTHWILQVHYNNASGTHSGESDNSGFQLCSTEQLRPNDAGIIAFGSTSFKIPPRTPKYTVKCDYKLGDKYKGVTFFAASPHMHTRGLALVTERIPGGKGAAEIVFGQDPFNFENQEAFPIEKRVEPGDVFRTRCTWKNTGDTEVTFGEKTGDEMCFNFLNYYPAIPDQVIGGIPTQSWVTPSLDMPVGGPTCEEEAPATSK